MFGFLNVYKPTGITSHDVISRLRKVLHIKKIGHAGTLDPLAEGVLPVAILGATRLIDFLPNEKEYLTTFKFGVVSKSYDTETELEFFSDKKISEEKVREELKNFEGEIRQKPPIYSAIKVGGRKLYEIAREGEISEIPERTIVVNKISLENFDFETQTGDLRINCSKGTYIRSIINDLGQNLGVGGVMTKLIRTKSGGMTEENSINLNNLIENPDLIEKNLISPENILPFGCYNLNENEFEKVKNGNPIFAKCNDANIFVKYDNKIVAYGEKSGDQIKIKKVFLQ